MTDWGSDPVWGELRGPVLMAFEQRRNALPWSVSGVLVWGTGGSGGPLLAVGLQQRRSAR